MINILISAALGSIVYLSAIGHLYTIMKASYKIQNKFERQQEKLIAREFIGKDLFTLAVSARTCKANTNTCDQKLERMSIQSLSHILTLTTLQGDIIYSLRKSAIPNQNKINAYALYRDDGIYKPQAIVENVTALRVQIIEKPFQQQDIKIVVEFSDNRILEIACTLPH